ncbi:pentapeptide repeat-containing protein [Nitrosococcus watsonii]|uniref:Pentapeptide repeat protein n=1 Tax=Nitrosococcus watsoni (strain C-113) TaxID=105559 RepID=D8K8E7_NITWC|nr:pentapeptide repeat-containing protein [Nitrosococcus watsonii]ADJ29067.1 pentapeptide repeat protein [Nitrosococcus watsonii C-113]
MNILRSDRLFISEEKTIPSEFSGKSLIDLEHTVQHPEMATWYACNLKRACFYGSDLSGVLFDGSSFVYADMRNASLYRASLKYCDLRGAMLSGANLDGAKLDGANLAYAVGNDRQVKSLVLEDVSIVYTAERMWLDDENLPIDAWCKASSHDIEFKFELDLRWWRKWKRTLTFIIKKSPAKRV